MLDRRLQLLDILCSPLSKGSLSLAIPLLPLFGGGIYLRPKSALLGRRQPRRRFMSTYRLPTALPFLYLGMLLSKCLCIRFRSGCDGAAGRLSRVLCLGKGRGVLDTRHLKVRPFSDSDTVETVPAAARVVQKRSQRFGIATGQ